MTTKRKHSSREHHYDYLNGLGDGIQKKNPYPPEKDDIFPSFLRKRQEREKDRQAVSSRPDVKVFMTNPSILKFLTLHPYSQLDGEDHSLGSWQLAAFALLGAVIWLSAVSLHMLLTNRKIRRRNGEGRGGGGRQTVVLPGVLLANSTVIKFDDLQFEEEIGGGASGKVWRAMWRGTPVAVKVFSGPTKANYVPHAMIEKFAAEINLLKGMSHPNICLYMGACLTPPDWAIVTELAAHGSLWDSLRRPLSPPYVVADGISCWQYAPRPLTTLSSHFPPPLAPPRGTWPWILVKKVAFGSARGMNYLHCGRPPILYAELGPKSLELHINNLMILTSLLYPMHPDIET